jgi:hypothetical protein
MIRETGNYKRDGYIQRATHGKAGIVLLCYVICYPEAHILILTFRMGFTYLITITDKVEATFFTKRIC